MNLLAVRNPITCPLLVCLLITSWHVVQAKLVCPTPSCVCETNQLNQKFINCNNRNLQEVPAFEPSEDVWIMLDLNNNNIANLLSGAFVGLKVQHITLSRNSLSFVHEDAFNELEAFLESVDFESNFLNSIPSNLFEHFHKLIDLNMKGNHLTQVSKAPSLQKLDITDNSIGPTPSGDFLQGLPELTELYLAGNSIASLPAGFFQEQDRLKILNMADNDLQDLSNVFSPLVRLEEMDLSYNNIHDDDISAINDLPTLHTLTLNSNQLVFPRSDLLQNLSNLKKFSINGNKLTRLSYVLTNYFPQLEELSVYDNEIDAVDTNAFDSSPEIKEINFGRNPLDHIPSIPLGSLTKLDMLSFWGTEIETLDSGSLATVSPTLTSLDLSHNARLSELPSGLFTHLMNMENLGLSYLNLSWIPDDTFTGLTKLTSLRMDSNRFEWIPWACSKASGVMFLEMSDNLITDVDGTEFLALPDLGMIYLGNNQISHFNTRFLVKFTNVQVSIKLEGNQIASLDSCGILNNPTSYGGYADLSLKDNPIHCGCHIKWLLEAGVSLTYNDPVVCQTPSRLKGRDVATLNMQDFECDSIAYDFCAEGEGLGCPTDGPSDNGSRMTLSSLTVMLLPVLLGPQLN